MAKAANRAAQERLERLRVTDRTKAPDPSTPSLDVWPSFNARPLEPEPEPPAGVDEREPDPAGRNEADGFAEGEEAYAAESAGELEQEGTAEVIVEEVVQEVTLRLRWEAAEAVALLRTERERLEDTLEWLQELAAEATERILQAPGMEAPAVEDDDDSPALLDETEVDLNQASHGDLRALGMSETQASRVIRHRDFRGEFRSVDELDHVAGFVPDFRDQLKQHLVVSRDGERPTDPGTSTASSSSR